MICPFCGSSQVMVINSRPNTSGSKIWRRRKCNSCNEVFTTYEHIDLSYVVVIKKNNDREKYSRSKLLSGIYRALLDKKDAGRGDMGKLANGIVNLVEKRVLLLKRKNISSIEIQELVLKVLRKKTPDGFLRYLAYRESRDPKKIRKYIKKFF